MTLPMPEQNAKKDVLIAAGLGALAEVPGLGGPVAAVQAALQAASRARDEEWWAMALARLASVEKTVDKVVNFAEPEFLAAAHRLLRAAQETSDDEKRERLSKACESCARGREYVHSRPPQAGEYVTVSNPW